MSETLVIGLLGCGTVGGGVLKLLQEKQELFAHRTQVAIEVRKVLVRDASKVREDWIKPELLTTDPAEILEDPEIQLVVEVMGGVNPAKGYLLAALQTGKHVVTANKALLAQHGAELFDAANEQDPNLDEGRPKELLYAQRMTEMLGRFAPEAGEVAQLAVRAQHIRRWTVPRSTYPLGKPGYFAWRTGLYKFHAETAG
ncbi:MAG: hypothetical protein CVV27_18230, partial [Candidatus Melainabacteria bacterium HGW-Melainabacteria-1]